jgi:hypothetical protein
MKIPGAFPASVRPYTQQLSQTEFSGKLPSRPKPSQFNTSGSFKIPGAFCRVLRTGIYIASSPPLGHDHSLQYIQTHPHSTSTACPGRDTFPASVLPSTREPSQTKPSGTLLSTSKKSEAKSSRPIQIPGDFPASVLPSTQQLSQVKSSQPLPSTLKQSQVKFSRSIKIPSSFPGSALSHSNHRPPSRIRGRPPTALELNSALLEYLLKSSGQISISLLKSWAASWGFFTFDGDSVFKVLDLLVEEIEDAVAEQTKGFIGRAGIIVEKGEILRILRILNSAIVQKIKGYLGFK